MSHEEEAGIMVDTWITVHSSSNLPEEGRRSSAKTKAENLEALGQKSHEDQQNVPFTMVT